MGDRRAGQAVHVDNVGAAQRVEVDLFHAIHIQCDAAYVAGETQAGAYSRQLDDFTAPAPVEEQTVGTGLPLDDVETIPRIPLKHIIICAQEGRIAALVPIDKVISSAADEHVVRVAAVDGVVIIPTVKREGDQQARQIPRATDGVLTAQPIDGER